MFGEGFQVEVVILEELGFYSRSTWNVQNDVES